MPHAVDTVTLTRLVVPRHMPLAEFERFPWGKEPVELVRGEVRPRVPLRGPLHPWFTRGQVVNALFHALHGYATAHGAGEVTFGAGYVLPGLPDTYRTVDLSFVRAGRLPALIPLDMVCRFAPDLGVLVVSPNETWSEVQERVEDLLEAGAGAVWVVNIDGRRVAVHTPSAGRVLGEGAVLDGAPVLPNFAMPVADVFAGVERPPRLPRGA